LLIDEGGMFRGRCIMDGEEVEPLMLPEMREGEQEVRSRSAGKDEEPEASDASSSEQP
jgi:hypothetical protein